MKNQQIKEYKSSDLSDLDYEVNSKEIDKVAQNIIKMIPNASKVLDNMQRIRNFSKTHDLTDSVILDSAIFKKSKPV